MNDSFRSERVTINGQATATLATYTLGGDSGPWVVFVNGHTRPASDFRAFMRFLQQLGYRTATLDNRGAGASEVSGPFSRADMVGDIVATMDHYQMEQSHLLGISMGGVLVQDVAANWPNRVLSLALVSTTCRDKYLQDDRSPWTNDLERVVEKMRPYFSEMFFQRNQPLIKSMCKQILKNVASGSFAQAAQAQKAAMDSYDTAASLSRVTCPCIAFHGTEDRIILPDVVDEMTKLLPSIQIKLYEAVGHLLLAECPKELYRDYAEFLGHVGDQFDFRH